MKTLTAKLYPTKTQEAAFDRILWVTRWTYNRALEHRIKSWKRRKEAVSYFAQTKLLTQWRHGIPFMASVTFRVQKATLQRVDNAFKAFFRRLRNGVKPGFPRFKGRDRWRSFEAIDQFKVLNSRAFVSGVGFVKYRGLQEINGKIKVVRVVKKASGWHLQLVVDDGVQVARRMPVASSTGIDVGLSSFAALSDGTVIRNPRWYRSSQRRLSRLHQIVSRRKKGSHRRRKAIHRLARMYERVGDLRRDWTHKLTRQIVDRFDLIAVEDLNVKGMARSRFAKSIYDAAWSQFTYQLAYKAANAGGLLVRVDPRGTSQECSECGQIVRKNLSVRVHKCKCGYTADRDVNAARNVLRRVTAELTPVESSLAGGDARRSPRRGSLKREGTSPITGWLRIEEPE